MVRRRPSLYCTVTGRSLRELAANRCSLTTECVSPSRERRYIREYCVHFKGIQPHLVRHLGFPNLPFISTPASHLTLVSVNRIKMGFVNPADDSNNASRPFLKRGISCCKSTAWRICEKKGCSQRRFIASPRWRATICTNQWILLMVGYSEFGAARR